jgi:hypothetical protein
MQFLFVADIPKYLNFAAFSNDRLVNVACRPIALQ